MANPYNRRIGVRTIIRIFSDLGVELRSADSPIDGQFSLLQGEVSQVSVEIRFYFPEVVKLWQEPHKYIALIFEIPDSDQRMIWRAGENTGDRSGNWLSFWTSDGSPRNEHLFVRFLRAVKRGELDRKN